MREQEPDPGDRAEHRVQPPPRRLDSVERRQQAAIPDQRSEPVIPGGPRREVEAAVRTGLADRGILTTRRPDGHRDPCEAAAVGVADDDPDGVPDLDRGGLRLEGLEADQEQAAENEHRITVQTPDQHTEIEDLGRRPFAEVHAEMLALAASIRAGRSRGKVLLVEHQPVYTAGRATPPDEIGDGVVPIERGGRITWHGPGQLVVYPIVPLPRRDVRAWLRALETFGVDVCARFGLEAEPSVDGTGVFVERRKVASIGVAIRGWTNLHGIAINVAMDLAAFHRIRPCGLDPEVMSDLSRCAGRPVSLDDAKVAARACLPALLGG